MCAKKAAPSAPKKPAAAKKPASSAKPKAAASNTNGAPPASAASEKTVPAKSAVTTTLAKSIAKSELTLSTHDIGQVAGEIWGLLAAKDAQTLPAIKKSIAAPVDVVAAAIGWLAREDKLEFTTNGKTLKVSLKG